MTVRVGAISESLHIILAPLGSDTVVGISLIHENRSVGRVKEFRSAYRHLDTGFETDCNLRGTFHTTASLDNKHTVRTLDTIDSCRGGILKNSDALDLIHVDLRQLFVAIFHIIDDDERFVTIGVQRADTTDKEVGSILTGLSGALLAEETGELTLESVLKR